MSYVIFPVLRKAETNSGPVQNGIAHSFSEPLSSYEVMGADGNPGALGARQGPTLGTHTCISTLSVTCYLESPINL